MCGLVFKSKPIIRALDADIMISGHTHELKLYEENNILYLNPGSLTGARTVVNTGKKEHIPSFMLLDVNQTNIVIYIYKLINDKGNFIGFCVGMTEQRRPSRTVQVS